MKLNMKELIQQARELSDRSLLSVLPEGFERTKQEDIAKYLAESEQTVELMKAMMTTHNTLGLRAPAQRQGVVGADGRRYLENWERGGYKSPIKITEALHANDASIMFKRVISDVLMLPRETTYFGQTILARTIRVDGVRQAFFPALGAIRAGDVSETGDYPEQSPSFMEHMLDLKVQKSGLKLSVSEDVIADSQWDIFGIYVTMASAAMERHKEEKIFNEAMAKAFPVFDNTVIGNTNFLTNGKDITGVRNGSVSFTDLMDVLGGVLTNGYSPTDLLLHPMVWVMLAKDPRLLFHTLHAGNYQQSVPMPGIDAESIQRTVPFGGINVVVTPQMGFRLNSSIVIDGVNGNNPLPACNVADILAVDRQSSLLVLQRDDKHMEEFKLQERDIHVLKVAERYAVGALDEGHGMAIMKNVRLLQNHESVFNIGQGNVS